jgi:hypothetical protein
LPKLKFKPNLSWNHFTGDLFNEQFPGGSSKEQFPGDNSKEQFPGNNSRENFKEIVQGTVARRSFQATV